MNQLWQEMMTSAERALAEVRRDAGYDPDDFQANMLAYVESLESKVREQAMTIHLCGRVNALDMRSPS